MTQTSNQPHDGRHLRQLENMAKDANSTDVLILVDVQVDFTTGALTNDTATEKVDSIIEKARDFDGIVILTQDAHDPDYLNSQEGKKLPIEHCIKGTEGIELANDLGEMAEAKGWPIYQKPTFGSVALAEDLTELDRRFPINSIELVGFCTDICVVSNALNIKAHLPEVPMKVDAKLCAGTSQDAHESALQTMRSCQIDC